VIERIVASLGLRVDESSPYADGRLPGWQRVQAIIPTLSLGGPPPDAPKRTSEAMLGDLARRINGSWPRGSERRSVTRVPAAAISRCPLVRTKGAESAGHRNKAPQSADSAARRTRGDFPFVRLRRQAHVREVDAPVDARREGER
jgi:hypothetical protein